MGGHLSIGYAQAGHDRRAGRLDLHGRGPGLPAGAARCAPGSTWATTCSAAARSSAAACSPRWTTAPSRSTAFLHWLPQRGPVRRVSLGPALVNAHGDLSVTGGGAGFSDLAVHETAGAVAAQVTLMTAKPAPVKLGLELGGRLAFLAGDDWTLLARRRDGPLLSGRRGAGRRSVGRVLTPPGAPARLRSP